MKQSNTEIKLQIGADKTKTLSSNQRLFNSLTKRIETLTKKIEKDKVILDNCLEEYSKNLPNLMEQYGIAQFEMAKTLAESVKQVKFSKKQYHDLSDTILALCNDAFFAVVPTEEMKAFYTEWSDSSFEEEEEAQATQIKQAFSEEMKNSFGVDIDFSDIDDTPEGMAKLQQRLLEAMEKNKEEEATLHQQFKKKKSKKQLEKEKNAKEEEDSKLKSVRSIYVALAKVLHPDTVMDETDKIRREELMKKVTVAYNNKDIATLLKMEMEWVTNETNNLDSLSDDKLKMYISTLKEQVKELEMESIQMQYHPRFKPINEFVSYDLNGASKRIKRREVEMKQDLKIIKDKILYIGKTNNKQAVLNIVKEIKSSEDNNEFLEELFSTFF